MTDKQVANSNGMIIDWYDIGSLKRTYLRTGSSYQDCPEAKANHGGGHSAHDRPNCCL